MFLILIGCQLQEPTKTHGILFLENRSNQLTVQKNNKNDVLKLIGSPHSRSFNNKDEWIYIERVLTKGSFHKLGQNVIKSNNVLVLSFNKYGIKIKTIDSSIVITYLQFPNKKIISSQDAFNSYKGFF